MGNINKNTAPSCYSEKKYQHQFATKKRSFTSTQTFRSLEKQWKISLKLEKKHLITTTLYNEKLQKKTGPPYRSFVLSDFFPHKKKLIFIFSPPKKNRHTGHLQPTKHDRTSTPISGGGSVTDITGHSTHVSLHALESERSLAAEMFETKSSRCNGRYKTKPTKR